MLYVIGRIFFVGALTVGLHANAGLPMLGVALPFFWCAFFPILLIEYWVMTHSLGSLKLFRAVFLSNFFSTLVGILLTWACLVLVQFATGATGFIDTGSVLVDHLLAVTIQGSWLLPDVTQFYWKVPTAGIFLLVPFFFASYWLEFFVTKLVLKEEVLLIKNAVWKANIASYAFLLCMLLTYLAYCVWSH